MKKLIAAMLVVGMLFTASQAIAAPIWSFNDTTEDPAVTPGYLDILSISSEMSGLNQIIKMNLNGDVRYSLSLPSISTYQVTFAKMNNSNMLFATNGSLPDANTVAFQFSNTEPYFYGWIPSGSVIGGREYKTNGLSTLEWTIQGTIPAELIYVAALTTNNNGCNIIDKAGPFNTTPIPGAIWLLSSGVLGLVGLKRRRSGVAL